MDAVQCAAAYSVVGSLMVETLTAALPGVSAVGPNLGVGGINGSATQYLTATTTSCDTSPGTFAPSGYLPGSNITAVSSAVPGPTVTIVPPIVSAAAVATAPLPALCFVAAVFTVML
jgi:hypothetical protein